MVIQAALFLVRLAAAVALALAALRLLLVRPRPAETPDAEATEYGVRTVPLSRWEAARAIALERELLERG